MRAMVVWAVAHAALTFPSESHMRLHVSVDGQIESGPTRLLHSAEVPGEAEFIVRPSPNATAVHDAVRAAAGHDRAPELEKDAGADSKEEKGVVQPQSKAGKKLAKEKAGKKPAPDYWGKSAAGRHGLLDFQGLPNVSTALMVADDVSALRDKAVEMMRHAWKSYRAQAWGHDEVGPLDGAAEDTMGAAITLVDGLTTLKVMGLDEEFAEAASWAERNLTYSKTAGPQSFFEVTIRGLGGLLGAYALSRRPGLLRAAEDIGRRLSKGFSRDSPHFPQPKVDLASGAVPASGELILAEVGSIQLEFRSLASSSNEFDFELYPDESLYQLLSASEGAGLVPSRVGPGVVSADVPVFSSHAGVSLGGASDSYYEYLLKLWLQDAKKENFLKDKWIQVVQDVHDKLVKKTPSGITYLAARNSDGTPVPAMEHLACFFAGNLELGYRSLPKEDVQEIWHTTAEELTRTCHAMYAKTVSGLSPDVMEFGEDMLMPEKQYQRAYHLRPEAAESIFYMWHFTGRDEYRHMAKDLLLAIDKHARAPYGFAAVADTAQAATEQINKMESYFLAETMLYLYLTFSPPEALDLNKYVLSTEGHPLAIDFEEMPAQHQSKYGNIQKEILSTTQ